MPIRLIDGLISSPVVADAFSDRSLVGAMVAFEAALARAEAQCGLVPAAAAAVIGEVASRFEPDEPRLAEGLRTHATLSIPLVEQLTAAVAHRDQAASSWVHWGATSQDVYDTALVLCLRRAWSAIEADHLRLLSSLEALSVRHADTLMVARTLLQPALPTTFGLKAAGWLAAVARTFRVWSQAVEATQVIQFGGAAGTLASLGKEAAQVEQALAEELDLAVPEAPWHAHRDRFAQCVAAGALYVGALSKIATDVSLLMQYEVGEVFEPGGGSSAMPHKRNPSACAAVLACGQRMPGLVGSLLAGLAGAHERSVGAWHAEGALLADAMQTTGAAVGTLRQLIDGLTIDDARMRQNLEATGGRLLAERIASLATPRLGRARATELVKAALAEALRSKRSFRDAVQDSPELLASVGSDSSLFDPATYLGAADLFRRRLLAFALPGSHTH
jgi:3-carboxy-cis,cis-muconate cycloisomerase